MCVNIYTNKYIYFDKNLSIKITGDTKGTRAMYEVPYRIQMQKIQVHQKIWTTTLTSNERAVKTRGIGLFKGSSIHSKVWEFLLCHKVHIRHRFKPCFCTLAYISNKKVDQPPLSFIVSIKKHKNQNTVTCWPWLGLINHFGINKKTDFCSKLLWNASIHP